MQASDLDGATIERLRMIVSQAEARLAAQNDFAAAADQRGSTLIGAAAALAAASAGIFAQALTPGKFSSLAIAALVAAIGFSVSCYHAVQSVRCDVFHSPGYRPRDFIADVRSGRADKVILAAIAEDLDERLRFNSERLARRGKFADRASIALGGTPIVAVIISAMLWFCLRA